VVFGLIHALAESILKQTRRLFVFELGQKSPPLCIAKRESELFQGTLVLVEFHGLFDGEEIGRWRVWKKKKKRRVSTKLQKGKPESTSRESQKKREKRKNRKKIENTFSHFAVINNSGNLEKEGPLLLTTFHKEV
jgi:hypothetical protein